MCTKRTATGAVIKADLEAAGYDVAVFPMDKDLDDLEVTRPGKSEPRVRISVGLNSTEVKREGSMEDEVPRQLCLSDPDFLEKLKRYVAEWLDYRNA